jgi:hypothetical protein
MKKKFNYQSWIEIECYNIILNEEFKNNAKEQYRVFGVKKAYYYIAIMIIHAFEGNQSLIKFYEKEFKTEI